MEQQVRKQHFPTKQTLMRSSIVIYGAMSFVGFEICWWYHKNIGILLGYHDIDWRLFLRIAVVAVTFLTMGQFLLEDAFPSYRRLKMTFAQIFKGLNFGQVVLLALLSSVGEELLFRGAIQPFLGVWFTAAIFAIMHVDPEGRSAIWTCWALIGGIVMGLAVKVTGSLWPAIFIHFGVNLISIRRVSRLADKAAASREAQLEISRGGP